MNFDLRPSEFVPLVVFLEYGKAAPLQNIRDRIIDRFLGFKAYHGISKLSPHLAHIPYGHLQKYQVKTDFNAKVALESIKWVSQGLSVFDQVTA